MEARWKFIIEPEYDSACGFSEGLAAVAKGDLYGFIDKTGKKIIDYQFEYLDYKAEMGKTAFSQGLAVVGTEDEDIYYQYINPLGDFINSAKFEDAGNFSEGMARFSVNGRWGFIDRQFKIIIRPELEDVGNFMNGLALARSRRGEKFGYIDKNGKYIISKQYDEASAFHEGLAAVKLNNKWGYINDTGILIIEPIYDQAGPFSDGLAAVVVNDKLKYINKAGIIEIYTEFKSGLSFSEGLAPVGFFDNERDLFYRNLENVTYPDKVVFTSYKKTGLWKWGYIDRKGNVLIPIQFAHAEPFSEGLAMVSSNDKIGFIGFDKFK